MAEGENQQAGGNCEAGNHASNRPAGLGARDFEVVSADIHSSLDPPFFCKHVEIFVTDKVLLV